MTLNQNIAYVLLPLNALARENESDLAHWLVTLISKKGAGILSILDDQCRAPGTTDKTFINDLYQKVSRQKRFQADYRQVGASKFAIIHYAGIVEYSSEGFVEKNRDELPREAAELLLSSSNKFLRGLAEIISGPVLSSKDPKKKNMVRSKAKSTTVGGQFTRQLQELRQKIDLTTPHYVRCLKPNDELVPDNFDPLIVADQLRCAGVVDDDILERGYSPTSCKDKVRCTERTRTRCLCVRYGT